MSNNRESLNVVVLAGCLSVYLTVSRGTCFFVAANVPLETVKYRGAEGIELENPKESICYRRTVGLMFSVTICGV